MRVAFWPLMILMSVSLTGSPSFAQVETKKEESIEFKKKTAGVAAPANPIDGPTEPYVFKNNEGTFKVSKGKADGSATYTWAGKKNTGDTLKFLAFGEIKDSTGIGVPAGQTYDVWIYECTDGTNKWYLAFGVDKLKGTGVPDNRFGLYYSYKDPTMGGTLKRWLTTTGTSRE